MCRRPGHVCRCVVNYALRAMLYCCSQMTIHSKTCNNTACTIRRLLQPKIRTIERVHRRRCVGDTAKRAVDKAIRLNAAAGNDALNAAKAAWAGGIALGA